MEKKISISVTFIVFTFFSLSGILSLPVVSQADTTTLSLSHFFPPTHFVNTEMVAQWVKEVEEASGGKVKINVFPGGTLLKPRETYDGIVSMKKQFRTSSYLVPAQHNPTLVEQGHCSFIQGIILIIDNFDNAAVDNHFGAKKAGRKSGIEC